MIGRVLRYHSLRRNRLPHSMAWRMSGLWLYANRARQWAAVAMVIAACLYLMSSAANSAPEPMATKAEQQAGEIEALRKIVAACLSDSTGRPIAIGDEWFLCGITSIGTFK